MEVFEVKEAFQGGYTFSPTFHLAKMVGHIRGSYVVIPSRLFGLSYQDYNKMIQSRYNATLDKGKGWYVGVSFKKKEEAQVFVDELNKRFDKLVKI